MTVTIRELGSSGNTTVGEASEKKYLIVGTGDEMEALTQLETEAPLTLNGLSRKPCSVERPGEGGEIWVGTAPYSPSGSIKKEPLAVGESSFSFDTGGGTQKITQSKNTTAFAKSGETAPDFQGAIGYNGKDIEGVDITVPVFNWTETHCLPANQVTLAYVKKLRDLTGKTNSAAFRGFAKGEVLFLGASGTRRGDEAWEITFKFAASENAENIVIGDITVTAKLGWDYLWVLYEPQEDSTAKAIVKRPKAAYVERVYDEGNYADLNIPEPLS